MTPFSVLLSLSSSIVNGVETRNVTLMAGAAKNLFMPAVERTDDWQPTVYEDLYAILLVLSDGQEYLVILTAGHIMQDFDETEIMRRVINRATGIPPNNIFINFSHTHNSIFPGGRRKKEARLRPPNLTFRMMNGWAAKGRRSIHLFSGELAISRKRRSDS